jgi:hypothetical protein
MAIYDFFLSRNSAASTPENYVGHTGRLFYDSTTGEIRISDGATPGGQPIPITIATTATAGSVRPGAGFSITAGGTLGLNAGPMFELDESDVFQLKAGTADRIGGIKAGEGVNIASDGTLTINLDDIEDFSFGDFTATTGAYTGGETYALLSSVNADEDIVIASNGTGQVNLVGEFHVHATNGDLTGSLETEPYFRVLSDGQVRILVPLADTLEGGMEIIGSDLGTSLAPGIAGTMLHLTGNAELPTRVYHDTLDDYSSYVFRRYNGSVASPTQVLANEAVARINFTPATDAGMGNVAFAQIRVQALEDQTTTAMGSEMQFFVTPLGSPSTSRISALDIRAAGVTSDVGFIGDLTGNADTVTNGVYTTDTGTVTNAMLAGSIANDKLANSTISGVALGSNLAALSAGNYLTGSDYNGSTIRTFNVDATTTNTASKVVARDSDGTIAATNTVYTTREAGSFGAGSTLTVDFATDKYVHATITGETVTVAYTNITAGKEIYVFFTNSSGGDLEVDSGVADQNATNAKGTENVKNGGTSQIRVTSFGTTVDDLYVHFKK